MPQGWPLRVRLESQQVRVGRWFACRWEVVALESIRGACEGGQKSTEACVSAENGWVPAPELRLYRDETAAYRFNLSSDAPRVFVVCSDSQEESEVPEVLLVTASQDRAADYLDGDDQAVHALPMPDAIHCWIEAFIGRTGEPELRLQRGKRRRSGRAEQEGCDGPC